MRADLVTIAQIFEKNNQLIFKGTLPTPKFAISRSTHFLGKMTWKRKRFSKSPCYDFTLRVNGFVDLSEDELKDIIAHEMIHYFIALKDMKDTSAHGQLFKHYMNHINSCFGYNIMVKFSANTEQRNQLNAVRKRKYGFRIVAIVHFKNGKMGYKVVPKDKKAIKKFDKILSKGENIASHSFYLTEGTFFTSHRGSTSPRIFMASKEVLEKNLANAVKLS